jgi:hypothetical protein
MMAASKPSPQATQAGTAVKGSAELSGSQWVQGFRGSDNTTDLAAAFRQAVERFIEAMTRAGVQVPISATCRPVARAWLMHWRRQVKHGAEPAVVPPLDGVDTPRTGMPRVGHSRSPWPQARCTVALHYP